MDKRAIDRFVHWILLIGGGRAALLLVVSVIAAIAEGRPLPDDGISFARMARSLRQGHPGGIAALGLLVLIFTPPLRVFGSILAFLRERDIPFVFMTTLVLGLM